MSFQTVPMTLELTATLTRQANIFLNDAGKAVLADYGLVFILDSPESSIQTTAACRWTAPEIINPPEDELTTTSDPGLGFTLASDVFAYAMTIVEVRPAPFLPNYGIWQVLPLNLHAGVHRATAIWNHEE